MDDFDEGFPKIRNLDDAFFRVERDGAYVALCFTDLTEDEQKRALDGRSEEWLLSLLDHLAKRLRSIGDSLGLERSCKCDGAS